MARDLIITHTADIAFERVCGEQITILASSAQAGSYEVYLHDAPQDAGPPPHSHRWDEAFRVIQGLVDFNCCGLERRVAAGGFVHVPAGTVHSFRYASPTAQVLGITSEGGAASMFTAVDRECGATPEVEKLLSVLGRNGVTVAVRAAGRTRRHARRVRGPRFLTLEACDLHPSRRPGGVAA